MYTIKNFLQISNIKQCEVSSRAKIPLASLNRFLNGWGTLPKEQLTSLAKFLKVPEEELLKNKIQKEG
jgi:hypothetical protein